MFELIFALFMAFACPAHNNNNNTNNGGGTVTTQDTGGDGEHIPPKPPKPGQ
ncbi:MAG TPA: hypothetical protein VKB19_07750 [Pedobacter sp.]|nr:hypothetical protein [Pedobacter sp.]